MLKDLTGGSVDRGGVNRPVNRGVNWPLTRGVSTGWRTGVCYKACEQGCVNRPINGGCVNRPLYKEVLTSLLTGACEQAC